MTVLEVIAAVVVLILCILVWACLCNQFWEWCGVYFGGGFMDRTEIQTLFGNDHSAYSLFTPVTSETYAFLQLFDVYVACCASSGRTPICANESARCIRLPGDNNR